MGKTANEAEQRQQPEPEPEPEPSVDATSDDCKIVEESCQAAEESDHLEEQSFEESRSQQLEEKLLRIRNELERLRQGKKESPAEKERDLPVLSSRVFCFSNLQKDSGIKFYAGFPNLVTFMAVFEFLDPGEDCENIGLVLKFSRLSLRIFLMQGPPMMIRRLTTIHRPREDVAERSGLWMSSSLPCAV